MENEQTAPARTRASEQTRGILTGIACYAFWGISPLYWELLSGSSAWEVVGHRMLWSLVCVLVLCLGVLRIDLRAFLSQRRAWAYLIPAGVIVSFNWSVYILAIASHNIVEAALGYYINPLISIIFGMAFFRERLTRFQAAAAILSLIGVVYFTVEYGRFPWLAILLALTFAIYGVIKKKAGYPAMQSLVIEGVASLPLSAACIAGVALAGQTTFALGAASGGSILPTVLLVLAGPVTALPLVLFAAAANKAPLVILGFEQYLSPTLSLIIGVALFGEAFTPAHAVCFAFIWAGMLLVVADPLVRRAVHRRARRA